MMIRPVLFASALILIPATNAATEARDAGDNVILVDVSKVTVPDTPGLCQVKGTVDEVLDGQAFLNGQSISLKVPCGAHSKAMPLAPAIEDHPAQLIDPQVLLASKVGFAHVDDSGALIWQPGKRSYGRWGIAWGYRVLDGTMLPVGPQRPSM